MIQGRRRVGAILNLVTSAMRASTHWWLKDHLNRVGRDRRSMDYAKSGGRGIGVVIKRCKWVEGTEIRDRILELGRDLTHFIHGGRIFGTSLVDMSSSFTAGFPISENWIVSLVSEVIDRVVKQLNRGSEGTSLTHCMTQNPSNHSSIVSPFVFCTLVLCHSDTGFLSSHITLFSCLIVQRSFEICI